MTVPPLPPGHTRPRTTTTDRTDADDATFAQVLGRIENMPACDESVEAMARRFHEAYERLAPRFGYETRRESAVPWEQVPARNRALMTAVCAELMPALKPAPGTDTSGQAVQRVLDLADKWENNPVADLPIYAPQDFAKSLRAAVAGPQRDHEEGQR